MSQVSYHEHVASLHKILGKALLETRISAVIQYQI